MKLLTIIIIPALLVIPDLHAQTPAFIGESELPPRAEDGFYRVSIPPAVSAYAGRHGENLRIVDETANEVPYFFHEAEPYTTEQFVAYKIVEKQQQPGCCTSLVLENTERNTINNILLRIKNADVSKSATLSGSDDQKQWYALKERFTLDAISNPHQTSEVRIVDFPLSNYAYYRLQINDSLNGPLNIVSAGYYKRIHEKGIYTRLDNVAIRTAEKATSKSTHCVITLDTAHWIDRITIAASGPPYFLRNATLYQRAVRSDKRGKATTDEDPIATVEISSREPTHIDLYSVKAQVLSLVINNEDNPPLHIDSLEVYQLNRYLVAYLKKGHRYTLKVGNAGMQQAVYDLGHFKKSIPEDLAIVMPGPFAPYDVPLSIPESSSIFNDKQIIWIAIAGIIVVMALMSFKMIKEARVSGNKDQT